MAGLLGGGGGGKKGGSGGLLGGVLDTVDNTTKDLPVVGEVTSPVLKTVGGVTDGLPVVGSGGGKQQAQTSEDGGQAEALAKQKKLRALKKQQLELERAELEEE